MIKHEEARYYNKWVYSTDAHNCIEKYILQQEKRDELLELYRELFNRDTENEDDEAYRDNICVAIKVKERELK